MRRIVVVGTSGSGKTTLARELARRLRARHIELDALHWEANWTAAAPDVFRRRVEQAVAADTWALCGGYAAVRHITFAAADTVVWLDYPMSVVFTRALARCLRRALTREKLWAGNRESLWLTFCSRESLLMWVIHTWRIRRRDYPKMFKSDACRHLRIVRLRSQKEADAWLSRVSQVPQQAEPAPQS